MKVASPNGDGYFFRRSVNFVDTSVKRGDIYSVSYTHLTLPTTPYV